MGIRVRSAAGSYGESLDSPTAAMVALLPGFRSRTNGLSPDPLAAVPQRLRPSSGSQPPRGLARTALDHPGFRWIPRSAPPFQVYFLSGSYSATRQDSLIARLQSAQENAFELLGLSRDTTQLQVFFLETRLQMETLLGRRATGFAEPTSGTVLLMTNADWRAFERHEVMHVVAERNWGPAAGESEWLREGLAQFADGRCGRYGNEHVANGLAAEDGWIPLDRMVRDFRSLPDLKAYLEAASLAGYIHRVYGVAALRAMWQGGPAEFERTTGHSLQRLEHDWQEAMATISARPGPQEIAMIRKRGCG